MAENTVKHRSDSVALVVANHHTGGGNSMVVTTLIVTNEYYSHFGCIDSNRIAPFTERGQPRTISSVTITHCAVCR